MSHETLPPASPLPFKGKVGTWVLRCLLVLALTAWPWSGPRYLFSRVYSAAANVGLGLVAFGGRGHARVRPAETGATPAAEDGNDSVLSLTVDGHPGEITFGVSARRELHLPLVLMASVIVSSPFAWRRRLRWLAVGAPIILLQALSFLGIAVVVAVAEKMPAVWQPPRLLGSVVQIANDILVVPPANRFALALGIALAIVFLGSRSSHASPNVARSPKHKTTRGKQGARKKRRTR